MSILSCLKETAKQPPESDVDAEIEKATEETLKPEEESMAGDEEEVEDDVNIQTPGNTSSVAF